MLKTFSWRVHVQPEYGISAIRISGSNDDINYKDLGQKYGLTASAETFTITIIDENFYKYFKVECKPLRTDWMLLTDVFYTGLEKDTYVLQQSSSLTKFEQPTLTENGVWGGDAFAVSASSEHMSGGYATYRAFDGDLTTDWHPNTPYEQPHEIKWYNPNPLFINDITIWQTGVHGYCVRDYQLFASNDDVDYQLIREGYSTAVKDESFTITVNNKIGYKYWSLKSITSNHSSLSPIVTYGEIKINAQERKPEVVRQVPQSQPVLTEAPSTQLGGTEFACTEDQGYLVTDTSGVQNIWNLFRRPYNGSDEQQYNGAAVGTTFSGWIYNPQPLIIKSISFSNHGTVEFAPQSVYVYGSLDGINYTKIGGYDEQPTTYPDFIPVDITNNGPQKYLKVEMVVKSPVCCVLKQIEIQAEQYVQHNPSYLNIVKPQQQPVLTENPTKGDDVFWTDQETYYLASNTTPGTIDYEQRMWRLFDTNAYEDFQINGVDTSKYYWGKFYNPKPLMITNLQIYSSQPTYYPAEIVVSGSNDDVNYDRLGTIVAGDSPTATFYPTTFEKTGFYKYYKIQCLPRNTTAILISLIKTTGYELQ